MLRMGVEGGCKGGWCEGSGGLGFVGKTFIGLGMSYHKDSIFGFVFLLNMNQCRHHSWQRRKLNTYKNINKIRLLEAILKLAFSRLV